MAILEIFLLSVVFLKMILHFDQDHGLRLEGKECLYLLLSSLVTGSLIQSWQAAPYEKGIYGVLAAYLVTASLTDYQTKTVHDFLHLAAGIPGIILAFCSKPGWSPALECAAYIILQMILFRRMYGTADCLTFCVCALYQTAGGRGVMGYLMHMGVTFLMLAAVQAVRKNIGRDGNLKTPIALVPYIATTIWAFL